MMNLNQTMAALMKAFGEPTLYTLTCIFDGQGPNVEKQLKRAQRILERASIWRKQVGELQRRLAAMNQTQENLVRHRAHLEERNALMQQSIHQLDMHLRISLAEREQLRKDLNEQLAAVGRLQELLRSARSTSQQRSDELFQLASGTVFDFVKWRNQGKTLSGVVES